MAIYHLSTKIVSRSSGRSAIGAAAYRSGEKLFDERSLKVFNYPGKSKQILFSEILLPKDASEWMHDREKLWNAVEKAENRKDSQVAREIELALPIELSISENARLLKEYITENFVNSGIVADINIHNQDRGNENIHAHVMLTTRRVAGDGFDAKKAIDLNRRDLLITWRENWANKVNHHLALNGHDIKIDHRSLKDQGIDLEPQSKRGPKHTRRVLTENTQTNLEIASQNGEKIYQDTKIALHAITLQQSTFTKQDLARFINRHTVDQEQFTRVFEKVLCSPDLVLLGIDKKGQVRYSYTEMVKIENEMLEVATTLSQKYTHDVSNPSHDRISMLVSQAAQNIKNVFVEKKQPFDFSTLTDEQKVALEYITKGNDLACILGYAGTGKSYVLGAAREIWEKQGYKVSGIALAGIAARGLQDGSGIASKTISRQLYDWNEGRDRLSERDIVVLDEIGMVGTRQYHDIESRINEAGAKLILAGEFNQLPPIEAGGARAVVEKIGYVELTEVRRQVEPWQREATKQLARGEIQNAINSYDEKGYIHNETKGTGAIDLMVEKWAKNLKEHPGETQIMLAHTNAEVRELNLKARDYATELGILGAKEHAVLTSNGEIKLALNEKILFLRNSRDLGVMNGMIGEVSGVVGEQNISVILNRGKSNEREINFSTHDYNNFSYGYAATIHKVQGATFDRVLVKLSEYFNKALAYVGFTRHRLELNIYHDFDNKTDLVKALSREASKDTTLDYPQTSKEILSYHEIEPLGDFGYMAFHHREIIKELEHIGEKGVSFLTNKEECGLIGGIISHNKKEYVVLEKEREFKLYNIKSFNDEKEVHEGIGSFVTINKFWDGPKHSFTASVVNSGLSMLEQSVDGISDANNTQSIFILGKGIETLEETIKSLESTYHKQINFNDVNESVYGIYQGVTTLNEKEYRLIETISGLLASSNINLEGIEQGSWVAITENQKAVAIPESGVPAEYIFGKVPPDLHSAEELERSISEHYDLTNETTVAPITGAYVSAIHEPGNSGMSKPENNNAYQKYDIDKINQDLSDSAESVVQELLGSPNEKLSSSTEWRYGNKGSFTIKLAGDNRGLWYDFEACKGGDLIGLIQDKTGMNFQETLKYVAGRFGGGYYIKLPAINQTASKNKPELQKDPQNYTQKYAEKLAKESVSITGTVVERYLKETRGIENIDASDIRYHPKVFTNENEEQKYMPAMLVLARDSTGKIQCVQATYLDSKTASKADLSVVKRTYASPSGAVVSLGKNELADDRISYIAEGIETGLSIKDAVKEHAVLVTLGKSNLTKITPESLNQKVVFCLDHDGPGVFTDKTIQKAAVRLISNGKKLFVALPHQIEKDGELQKTDFNDIAKTYGINEVKNNLDKAVLYREWQVTGEISQKDIQREIEREQLAPNLEERKSDSLYENQNEQVHDISNTSGYSEQKTTEELFEEKMDKIVRECSAIVNSYAFHQKEHEKILKEGLTSPYLQEKIPQIISQLKQYLKAHCNDKEILIYLRDNENKLFNDINNMRNNILSNTIRYFESKELLADLTRGNSVLYEKVLAVEAGYREKEKEHNEACNKMDDVFKYGGTIEELNKQEEIFLASREAWDKYAKKICNDPETIRLISQHDPSLFEKMNNEFHDKFTEAIKKEELYKDYSSSISPYEKTKTKEERVQTMYDHYKTLKEAALDADANFDRFFDKGGSMEELKRLEKNTLEADRALDDYSNEACRDRSFMNYLRTNDKSTFKEMDKRFNELLNRQMERMKGFERMP